MKGSTELLPFCVCRTHVRIGGKIGMKENLLAEALIKITSGIFLMMALLFIPAGDIRWFNGWLLMGLLFIPMAAAGLFMYFKAPDLLRSRLRAKETEKEQQGVIAASGVMFILSFLLAGLNYRFGWTSLPPSVTAAACVVFLIGYALFAEVLRENSYLSRVVEVQQGQKVVDTGLYGVVRHPMYFATVLLFLSMPLILGSLPSFVIMLCYIPLIILRIRNEEKVLEEKLDGYREYEKKVKYRLLPLIY